MNPVTDLKLPPVAVLQVLAAGVLLFGVLKGLNRISTLPPTQHAYRAAVRRFFPAFEAAFWLFYAYWGLGVLFAEGVYHTVALSILLAILLAGVSWFAIKDWIAGVVLRMQDVYEAQQSIQLGEIRGRIRRMGRLAMEIEQANGDTVKIPYSKISGHIHWKHQPEARSNYYRFQVVVSREAPLSGAMQSIRTAILNAPWSSLHNEPRITLLRETDHAYTLEAVVYASRREFAQWIEEDVKRHCTKDGEREEGAAGPIADGRLDPGGQFPSP